MKKVSMKWAAVLGLTAAVSSMGTPANAWDAEAPHDPVNSTHLWIASSAVQILARNQGGIVAPNEIGYLQEPQYRSRFEQGLYDADFLDPFNNGGYALGGWKSHFYDPDTNQNYNGETSPTALTEGSKYYRYAGQYMQAGNYDKAFYFLGVATHYFTDATQPMHSTNFTALSSPMGYHSDYETFAQAIQDSALVSDANGSFTPDLTTPESWIKTAAVNSKAKFSSIFNSTVSQYYNAGNTAAWQSAVKPGTQYCLDLAQRETAGFLHQWFKTYVGDTPVHAVKNNGLLLDAKGNALQAEKKYLLVPYSAPTRGLTFQSSNNWDYVLQTSPQTDSLVHGTPVVLHKEGDTADQNLYQGSDASLEMTSADWSGYQHFTTYKKSSFYPYQDSYGVPIYLDVKDHRDVYQLQRSAKGGSYLTLNTGKYLNTISPASAELYLGWMSVSSKNWAYLTTDPASSAAAWQFVPAF